jgi:uncharacterized protein YecT (DUF1311 family)
MTKPPFGRRRLKNQNYGITPEDPMRRSLLLVPMMIMASTAFAQEASVKAKLEAIDKVAQTCIDRSDATNDIFQCNVERFEAADALLNEVYKEIVNPLKADASMDAASAETLKRTVAAQRAWVAFRDAECERVSAEMLNGTFEKVMWMGCRAELTSKRVEQLAVSLKQ